jgi:hypothetical protein
MVGESSRELRDRQQAVGGKSTLYYQFTGNEVGAVEVVEPFNRESIRYTPDSMFS